MSHTSSPGTRPQHPQQTTRTVTLTVAPADFATRLAQTRFRDLVASVRPVGPSQLVGIVSGAGNQGSACTANMQGHAGTGCDAKSVPRNLKVGQSGSKGQ